MIGIVADDITGANDIGIMFAKSNVITDVYAYDEFTEQHLAHYGEKPEIVILDTNSRLDAPKLAYEKVFQATRMLRKAGARLFINKTCSVFRGNIGAEFDAMLDAIQEDFAIVVLGFPKNGRTTVDNIHYVHGKPLEESEFRNDPVHPMLESRLVDILQSQTRRKVDYINFRTIDMGPDILRERIEEKKRQCNYLILDVKDQLALQIIAKAVKDQYILCGSSALAEELVNEISIRRQPNRKLDLPKFDGVGMMCVAGSLMPQTAAQIKYMEKHGAKIFELNSLQILDEVSRQKGINRLIEEISDYLLEGKYAVLHSSNDKRLVEETKIQGAVIGLSSTEVSRLVSESIAEITVQIMERTGQNRLVVAGGETSAAVCARMGIRGLRIWKEIESGLPSCISLSKSPVLLALKSGSFGRNNFFAAAMEHLVQQ